MANSWLDEIAKWVQEQALIGQAPAPTSGVPATINPPPKMTQGLQSTQPGIVMPYDPTTRTKSGTAGIINTYGGLNDQSEFDDNYDTYTSVKPAAQSVAMGGPVEGEQLPGMTKPKKSFGDILSNILPIALPAITGAVLGSRSDTFGPLAGGLYGLTSGVSNWAEGIEEQNKVKQKAEQAQLNAKIEEAKRIDAQIQDNIKNGLAYQDLLLKKQKIEEDIRLGRDQLGLANRKFTSEETHKKDVLGETTRKNKADENRQQDEQAFKQFGPAYLIDKVSPGLNWDKVSDDQLIKLIKMYETGTGEKIMENLGLFDIIKNSSGNPVSVAYNWATGNTVDPEILNAIRMGGKQWQGTKKGMQNTTTQGNQYNIK